MFEAPSISYKKPNNRVEPLSAPSTKAGGIPRDVAAFPPEPPALGAVLVLDPAVSVLVFPPEPGPVFVGEAVSSETLVGEVPPPSLMVTELTG